MNRVLRLPTSPLLGTSEVVLEVPHALVSGLALELALLTAGLSDSVRLVAKTGAAIVLSLGEGLTSRADRAEDEASFEIARNQAEYLLMVLLRAHRDGTAEVNHVHIEGISSQSSFDLTILFELSAPPMTPEEAKKLMDD